MTVSKRHLQKSWLSIVLLLISASAAADNDAVDIRVEWRPGTYVYSHRVSSELHYAGEQQIMESAAEMRFVVADEGQGRTRFRVSLKPTESKVDGASLKALPQNVQQMTVLLDPQGKVLEFDAQDATGASSVAPDPYRDAPAGLVIQPPQFSRENVHVGDQWSTQHVDSIVQWTVDQVAELAGVVDLGFRYIGNFVQMPESAVMQAVGFSGTPRQKSLVGQVRIDRFNSRLVQMSHRSSLTLDIDAPGEMVFADVTMKTMQFMALESFEAPATP